MKNTKRILSIVLALTMLFALAVPAMANSAKPYKFYVSLGDSIAAGCSLPGFKNVNASDWVPGNYPTLIKEALAEDGFQGARCGYRTNEIRVLLEEDYLGDDVTVGYMPFYGGMSLYGYDLQDGTHMAGMLEVREDYRNAISKADLVTVQIGSNDLMANLIYALMMAAYNQPEESEFKQHIQKAADDMVAKLQESGDFGASIASFINTVKTVKGYAELIAEALKIAYESIEEFKDNWDLIVEDINALNPDTTIVAVGMYNPLSAMEGLENFLPLIDPLFDIMNNYMESGSKYSWRTVYADVMDITVTNTPDDKTDGGDGMHPDLGGHEQIAAAICAALEAGVQLPFIDVADGAWYADGVKYCYSKGIMFGATDKLFAPAAGVTRAQLAAILYRMAGSPDIEGMSEPFIDVPNSYWAHDAITWAYRNGIAYGVTKTLFSPMTYVSRGQFVTMLYRYAGSPEVSGELSFKDAALIPASFRDAVLWASENGIVSGYSNGFFNSAFTLSRAQMAVIIERYSNMA